MVRSDLWGSLTRAMSDIERRWLSQKLMKSRDLPATIALARLANYCTLVWKNLDYNIEHNGEAALLKLSRASLAACRIRRRREFRRLELGGSEAPTSLKASCI